MTSRTLILEDDNYKTVIDIDGEYEVEDKYSDYTSDGCFYVGSDGNVYCEDYNINSGAVLINGEDAEKIKKFLSR